MLTVGLLTVPQVMAISFGALAFPLAPSIRLPTAGPRSMDGGRPRSGHSELWVRVPAGVWHRWSASELRFRFRLSGRHWRWGARGWIVRASPGYTAFE